MGELSAYAPLGAPLLALGGLHLVQLLVADVLGLRSGHTPGTPIEGGHDDPLFRAARAHANTAESLGVLFLFLGAAVLLGGDPVWLSRCLWAVVGLRLVYTLCYWSDWRRARSVSFALALVGIALVGISALRSL